MTREIFAPFNSFLQLLDCCLTKNNTTVFLLQLSVLHCFVSLFFFAVHTNTLPVLYRSKSFSLGVYPDLNKFRSVAFSIEGLVF